MHTEERGGEDEWPPSHLLGQYPTKCSSVIRAHAGPVSAAFFNSRSAYILSAGVDRQVRLFSCRPRATQHAVEREQKVGKTDEAIKTYDSANNAVLALALTASDKLFAQAGKDRSVNVVDVEKGEVLRRFNAHTGAIHALAFAGAGPGNATSIHGHANTQAGGSAGGDSLLLAAGFDARCRIYDLRASGAWKPIMEMRESRDTINCLDVNGHLIRTAGNEGVLRTYDARMGHLTEDVIAAPIVSLSSTTSSLLVSTASSKKARHLLLSPSTGQLQRALTGHVLANASSPFRSIFVRGLGSGSIASSETVGVMSGDEAGGARLWKVQGATEGAALRAGAGATDLHKEADKSIAQYPASTRCVGAEQARDGSLCTYHEDGTLRLWST